MYHGVLERDAAALRAQLEYLRRRFHIVPLGHMVEALAVGRPLRNEIVLTFDDGLRNNATVAYPILKSLGTPATFFVCPGLIDGGRWLWTHEARCRLRSLPPESLPDLGRQLSSVARDEDGIVAWMKTLSLHERQAAEEKIRHATPGFQPNVMESEACDLMDWETLKSLDPDLITVGSHTLTHPILPTLDEASIRFEMAESRRQLEQRLNRAVNYFCYPNGAFHDQTLLAAKQTYSAAVTAENGVLNGKNHDLHRIPRIPATRDCALLAWRLHRPGA
jgi:peptidoglycan/xylan/chitin deacetylase (PgdA/CDA1 family)